jgi:hypothetical protein
MSSSVLSQPYRSTTINERKMRWSSLLPHVETAVASLSTSVAGTSSDTTKSIIKDRNLKSLALSVYFKIPEFDMKEYEILSRASAFLLGVDPPEVLPQGKYAHLEISEQQRQLKQYQHEHGGRSPAGGPKGRLIRDLGWLEFVPKEYRPQVHIVCSSHVIAPYLWKNFYPQEWLSHVKHEHCVYSLEVYDPQQPTQPLAKLALNKYPFHHPEGRDIALIHLQEEQSSLGILQRLGVNILHLRDPEKLYQKGEEMIFDGFVVREPNPVDQQNFEAPIDKNITETIKDHVNQDDIRIFYPYQEKGTLSFHTQDRFFATTPEPLPEGYVCVDGIDTGAFLET